MNLLKLIELSNKTYPLLGWAGGGAPEIELDTFEEGDITLFFDVHERAFEGNDLLPALNSLQAKMESLWGRYSQFVEVIAKDPVEDWSKYQFRILLKENYATPEAQA